MKFQLSRSRARTLVASVGMLLGALLPLHGKPIRLRNEVIVPPSPPRFAAGAQPAVVAAPPVSGLFLVQFTNAPSPAWRQQLRALGVELLRYVPEATFIARFRQARPDQVQALGFVSWIGPYRPEYKLHRGLTTAIQNAIPGAALHVSVLLAPGADPRAAFQARRLLRSVRQESHLRFGTVLRGPLTPGRLTALAQSDAVLWIEEARPMKLVDEVASKIIAGDAGPGLTTSLSLGYDGSGVAVAVADTGLNNGDAATMHPDLSGRTPVFMAYGGLPDASDEHGHGTHVAGIIAGNGATGETDPNGALYGLGVAPGADLITQRIFDGAGNYYAPPSNETLTRDATRAGAIIGSNSWGNDVQGRYDLDAAEFDELVRDADALKLGDQPYILEFSAGNAGPGAQTMDSPAVAKNVIATGACENNRLDFFIYDQGQEVMADFSSRGPCEDGRLKPDIVTPGTWISSLKSAATTDANAWAPIDDYYFYMGGTSQAGPHASGAAAVLVQFYRQTYTNAVPSPALVKALLINSAVALDDPAAPAPAPNMDEGWGRVDLPQILDSTRGLDLVDQSVLLTNGAVYERRVVVNSDQPLKITLAYTDVPGLPAAIPALVNDLDLEVVAPDGHLYRGNQFNNGESVPDPPQSDTINNVEGVRLSVPVPGEYVVRVRAANVVEDARADTAAIDQDFALVLSGDLPAAGTGMIMLDHAAYTAPGRINIRLFDRDLAGVPTATVVARSTTETNGESVVLFAAGATGSFTGAVATATGPAAPDGRLEIQNGDTIQVVYFDASAGLDRVAQARADLQPPAITSVVATNAFGEETISWTTDEPATSLVRFNTNSTLALTVTDPTLTTNHSATLSGLAGNRTYWFAVVSTDEAGNSATNSNGGALFSFVAVPAATVLLVDEYQDPYFDAPPLSGYTAPLDALGVSYEVWDMAVVSNAPSLTELRPYRAVIWRVPELTGAWSAGEQLTVSNYLQSGGALLVASMDVLSRLEEVGATNFIQNVLQVQSHVTDPGVAQIIGSTSDPVGSGINSTLDYSEYDTLWMGLVSNGGDISDTITPTTNAAPVLFDGTGATAGLRWPRIGQSAPGRLVFFSFPLDAVPFSGSPGDDRAHLLRNTLAFLVPGLNGLATVALDSEFYTIPSLVTVELDNARLAGAGSASLTAATGTQTNGVNVTVYETATKGVFTGHLTLVPADRKPAAGQLRARDGDTLTVEYLDPATHTPLSATALVDTQLPGLTNIVATPDYQEATVSWDSDKPADTLVQFGTSQLLDRTAYDAVPSTTHQVTLRGLTPDTVYYFQVTSTDQAGNTATADNQGRLYTFRTLRPLPAPWADHLDTGATNWTVSSNDGSQSQWTLGVPANGHEAAAHSPPDAWGSDLDGASLDYSETFLISPAIELTGGNTATLTFWHSYDFTEKSASDILEWGTVYIATNNVSSPVTLAQFASDAVNWAPVTVDLTPYAGNVVSLIWAYQIFSLAAAPRAGWLVDDVSVTVSNVMPGTVVITNNLAHAGYVLTGPLYRRGSGFGTTLTNAPPGQYVIEYADALNYQAPPPQTNTLRSGQTVVFEGIYLPRSGALLISNNLAEARFKLTGPTSLQGAGLGAALSNAPPGTYAISYGSVPFFQTPPPQTNVLATGATLVLRGNYTFTDANGNGIPDAWELQHFGVVDPNRTRWTDTDGDGMSDYAEFMAGTDPKDPRSVLRLTAAFDATHRSAWLAWPSVPDRAYRVEGSANAVSWSALSDWTMGSSTNLNTFVLPPLTNGGPYLFRVGVRP